MTGKIFIVFTVTNLHWSLDLLSGNGEIAWHVINKNVAQAARISIITNMALQL